MINRDINILIRLFSNFLNLSWKSMTDILENNMVSNEDFYNDWFQANWELLIERNVLKPQEFLISYGYGADYYGDSSRILERDCLPTHTIVLKSANQALIKDFLNNQTINVDGMEFNQLVAFRDGFYFIEPAFNYVLVEDKNDIKRVFDLRDVIFELKPISNSKR